jgi:hypothetical protein
MTKFGSLCLILVIVDHNDFRQLLISVNKRNIMEGLDKKRLVWYDYSSVEEVLSKEDRSQIWMLFCRPGRHQIRQVLTYTSFEGEAILSIGKSIESIEKGAAGIINAMPFGCYAGDYR